ncbi:MAG: T9SS type A sorting domain-containing protein [Bacteroidetes bacterium]|nr:T9SS type A sorting domain-containing protein [Bacteroidota bacterium]
MKNIFTSLVVFMAGVSMVSAQTQGFSCTAGEETQKQYAKHPELMTVKDQLDAFTKDYVRQQQQRRAAGQRVVGDSTKIIPVVFHIQHDAGVENISDATVYTEMEHWNEYMQARNAELSTTDSTFVPLIGNPDIEFRLAQIDPNGNPTNGIERIYTQSTYLGNNNTKLDPWPRDKYLNVWLTKGIDRDVTFYGTLAYSMYPSSVATYTNNDVIDGILAKYFVVGTNTAFSRPTLAHECGHWMNLEHTWGNTNAPEVDCGDDDVDDTPITKGNQNTCIHYLSRCNQPIIENEQNIMNYAECHFMFTQGQVDRMHAALHSSVAGRSTIWSAQNLIATGTVDSLVYPNPNSLAVPVADFAVNNRLTCIGTAVTLTDASWNAEITGLNWTIPADANFENGTGPSDATVKVSFNTPGWQEITLTASNANGSNSKTKTMIYVSDGTPEPTPYFEGFEDAAEVQAKWQSQNYDNNNTYFQQATGAGHYSNGSYMMNMYNATYDGDRDDLVSPLLDLSGVDISQQFIDFDYSWATNDVAHMTDSLATFTVYASKDCGSTWTKIYYNLGGYNLYNAGTIANHAYVPGRTDEYWQHIRLSIPSAFVGNQAVNFKWSVTSAKGANQFYIDNINIGESTAGVTSVRANTIGSMNIIPNPANGGTATLALNITNASDNTTARLYDMEGREVMTIFSGETQAGQKNVTFNTDNIANGVYLVKVSDGKTSIQKRFVKM